MIAAVLTENTSNRLSQDIRAKDRIPLRVHKIQEKMKTLDSHNSLPTWSTGKDLKRGEGLRRLVQTLVDKVIERQG